MPALRSLRLALLAPVALCASLSAQTEVLITVTGTVEYNRVNPPLLGIPNPGDPVTMTITIDADTFVDNPSFPTRGYPIDPANFTLTMGSVTVGLQDPLAVPAYFVVRNNDPGVDGFMLTSDLSFPNGVPLDVNGAFGAFRDNFYVTYGASTIPSLDIVDAVGTYDFTGLTVFNWTIDDGAFNPIGLLFAEMTIEVVVADPLLRRGDCNADANENIADAIFLLSVLFPPPGGPSTIACVDSCDANDDGAMDIADAISILGSLFGAVPVPLPPPTGACGFDPTGDALPCDTPAC